MEIRRVFYSFILLALLSVKVSAFHVYQHHMEDSHAENCELCEYTIQNQSEEFSSDDSFAIPSKITIVVIAPTNLETQDIGTLEIAHKFPFSRPPPQTV